MKKIVVLFALTFILAAPAAKAENNMQIRTSPVLLLVGAFNAEFSAAISSNWSVGAGGLAWNPTIGDVEISMSEAHVIGEYWFSGAFKQGWFASVFYSTLSLKGEERLDGVTATGTLNTSGLGAGLGYHWQWDSFFMELGAQFTNYSNATIHLESSTGEEREETIPTSGVGLAFNLGWAF